MGKFDRYAFSAQPSFDEAETRKAFSHAVPLKTLVIYCYDPRAAEIPTPSRNCSATRYFPGRSSSTDPASGWRHRRPFFR